MRKTFTTVLLLFVFNAYAQLTSDYAVQVQAMVQESPAKISLKWKPLAGATSYTINRKALSSTSWGTAIASVPGTDSIYNDLGVNIDSAYEYRIVKQGSVIAYGYIYAGIKNPPIHQHGAMLLLVDSTFTDSCSLQILQMMKDLSGDGWQIIRYDLSRTLKDTFIKGIIVNEYFLHPDLIAVMILGHLAVPYSGDLNPDGHPDHLGAWPADVYYGELTGSWTDNLVNDIAATRPENQNALNDGKWDQTSYPTNSELQVSRIDFYNMPSFATTEVQRMRSYLNKDHQYKMDSLNVIHRALIDDNFGAFGGEAFAANGFRNFPPLVGRDSMREIDFISTLNTNSYQWAYGCGGGWFQGAGGIGATPDFAINQVNGIFTMLFGSYFGDWDSQDNFLRAPLSSSNPALTCCWAGRPNWFFHQMALGENIGFSAQVTQNNTSLYTPNYGAHWVHVALMGDLSLRSDYIHPPVNLTVTPVANHGANLSWTASNDASVIGYYVYRSNAEFGNYQKISSMIAATSYSDSSFGTSGLNYYMVRACKLQDTPSGTYYNLSIGITDSATVTFAVSSLPDESFKNSIALFPNPANDQLNIIYSTKLNSDLTIRIIDLNGRILEERRTLATGGVSKISFDIKDLPSGSYSVLIFSNEGNCSKNFVKP